MLRYAKWFGLLFLIALTSCTYLRQSGLIQDRDTDYLKARSIPPLRIPPDLSSSTIEAHYPVSDVAYPATAQPVDLTPPGFNTPMATTPEPRVAKTTHSLEMTDKEQLELDMATLHPVAPADPIEFTQPNPMATTPPLAASAVNEAKTLAAPATIVATNTTAKEPTTGDKIRSTLKSLWPWSKEIIVVAQSDTPQTMTKQNKAGTMLSKIKSVWPWHTKATTSVAQPADKVIV